MGFLRDHEAANSELNEFLGQLISAGRLEGATLGISKLVMDKGEDALSEKQKYVFQEHVIKANSIEECRRCGSGIPWSEMFDAYDSHLCSWCAHMVAKDD